METKVKEPASFVDGLLFKTVFSMSQCVIGYSADIFDRIICNDA